MRTRLPRLLLLTLAAGAALTAGACAVQADAGTAPAPKESAETAPPAAEKPAAKKPAAKKKDRKAPACRTENLDAVITAQNEPSARGTSMALVQLTNAGSNPCRIDGWASISLVDAADEVVDVPTEKVREPGDPAPTTLKPDASAWFGIKWTGCDKGSPDCPAGNTLRFSLEASTDGDVATLEDFPAAERSDITMSSLKIGSVQPSRQGVVAW